MNWQLLAHIWWITQPELNQLIKSYTDLDFTSNPVDRRSISGNIHLIGGAAISWLSKRQSITATSTCEAEYVAASQCTRHVAWLRALLDGLGYRQDIATVIFCDNQSAIALSKDFQFHSRSKHIDVQHHFIRDLVNNGSIEIRYVPSTENIADLLTKPLPHESHMRFTRESGLLPA